MLVQPERKPSAEPITVPAPQIQSESQKEPEPQAPEPAPVPAAAQFVPAEEAKAGAGAKQSPLKRFSILREYPGVLTTTVLSTGETTSKKVVIKVTR